MKRQILLLFSHYKSINYYFCFHWCFAFLIANCHFTCKNTQQYCHTILFRVSICSENTQTTGRDQMMKFDTRFSFDLRYITQSFLVLNISISRKGLSAYLKISHNLKREIQLVSQSHSIDTKQVLGRVCGATCYLCIPFRC